MESNKKNITLIVIVVVIFAIAGYRLFATSSDPLGLPDEFLNYGVCLACKQENDFMQKSTDHEPFTCPSCGENAVYRWLICLECQTRFVPPLVRDDPSAEPHPMPFPHCPNCGCPNVAAYLKDLHESAGDAKLPAWPIK